MDQRTQDTTVTYSHHQIPPAQLWIGLPEVTNKQVLTFLQKTFCLHNSCSTCYVCKCIVQKQHHSIVWLYPEKQYTLDELEIIFKTIAFKRNADEKFFFIIQKADFLTPACANSLLKSLEEPPSGYHFLLLAQNNNLILPTIHSRCVTKIFSEKVTSIAHQDLFDYFTTTTFHNPSAFLAILDQSKINERESIELLDTLLQYWIEKYKQSIMQQNQHEQSNNKRVVDVLQTAMTQQPMPGSSKIFWKNLFLQMKF